MAFLTSGTAATFCNWPTIPISYPQDSAQEGSDDYPTTPHFGSGRLEFRTTVDH